MTRITKDERLLAELTWPIVLEAIESCAVIADVGQKYPNKHGRAACAVIAERIRAMARDYSTKRILYELDDPDVRGTTPGEDDGRTD